MQDAIDRAVRDFIQAGALMNLLRGLIRCPSVTGEEGAVARQIAMFLDERGLPAQLRAVAPGRPNVTASYGTHDGPTLLLTGHTDTVPVGTGWTRDPFGGEIVNGRMYGRGAADMKGGLAAMLIALAALASARPKSKGRILFAACVDEEVGGSGTRALLHAGVEAAGAIIGEPTSLHSICSAKGNCYFKVTVRGRAAHAGVPSRGISAIYGAADLVHAVEQHNHALAKRTHPLLGSSSVSVGLIEGGETISAVPAACVFHVDRRLLPGETSVSALQSLQEALAVGARRDCAYASEAVITMELPAMETDPDHPLVSALLECARAAGAPAAPPQGWSASCDGGLLAHEGGIPTLLFGPGSIEAQAHQPDEYVRLADVEIAARAYGLMCARFLADPHSCAGWPGEIS